MRLRTRTWLMISVLALVGAAIFWRLGEQRLSDRAGRPSASPLPSTAPLSSNASSTGSSDGGSAMVLPAALRRASQAEDAARPTRAAELASTRLRNTARAEEELLRDDRTLLLRNAVIDTAGAALDIPEHLRAGEEAGSYIVQSAGPISTAFRRTLEEAGATFVSYLPNNAYLVKATAAQAQAIQGRPGIGAVLPNQPYFKIAPSLLAAAVRDEAIAADTRLNVTVLPGSRSEGLKAVEAAGARVVADFETPFGPAMVVETAGVTLAALASIPEVQDIEVHSRRQLLNDLARTRLGISSGTNVPGAYTNYLELNGTNVVINVNDSGVDATHPDLVGRVTADLPSTLVDLDGHGTHVTASIGGSGMSSASVSNAPGSTIPGADFRGMAPAVQFHVLPVDLVTGPLISDAYMHEAAATNYYVTRGRTNLLISNNSWGYTGAFEYTVSSASFDAATRDALPALTGSQPILYVFAAGNDGFGGEDGQGGEAGSIQAPANAKNVISVGALESPRQITNEVVYLDEAGELQTNQVFLLETDTDFQITSFSGRGNVEPGIEGRFGRFKPDVVAPGAFIASARSRDWEDPRAFSAVRVNRTVNQQVVSAGINYYSLFVPSDAGSFRIRVLPNFRSPTPFPGLPVYLNYGDFPTTADLVNTNNLVQVPPDATLAPGDWFYAVGNLTPDTVSYDVQTIVTITNDFGNYFDELKKLNDGLAPHYRYESGTSMSTPVVTGLLALYLDYFQRQERAVTPALLKALLINSARSAGSLYNFNVRDVINHQGWGVVNITNALPAGEIGSPTGAVHVLYADHTGAQSLVTGETRAWDVVVGPEARDQILKVTLVWTDPPGNPSAGVKLVNDLDLVVRDVDNNEVYVGNDIPFRSDFNTPREDLSSATNDVINNVENILLRPPLGTNYTIEVHGRRVNVNAITEHPDGIAQDFALAVSMETSLGTSALTVTPRAQTIAANFSNVSSPTNGLALLSQRVGANPPKYGTAPGATNQWTFFVFTNLQQHTPNFVGITNGSNVAFITFLPPNLGEPRETQADIDLYVSTDPGLLNLVPTAVDSAFKSTKPGGTELVFFTNAPLGEVYYVGVKAEDQQAAEFGFVALSSNIPFDEDDAEGNRIVRGLPFNMAIPDGSPDQPQQAYVFGVATRSFEVQRVVATNTLAFDSTGDIFANLSHNESFVVLHNHALDPTARGGVYTTVYDDSNSGNVSYGSLLGIPTDGPGRLTDFIGTDSSGPWILTLVDNALTQMATNVAFTLQLQPAPDDSGFLFTTVEANSANFYSVDVPSTATNLIVTLTGLSQSTPLFVAVRRGDLPSFTVYDKGAVMAGPGGVLTVGRRDVPPLNPGRYYIGVFNPNAVPVNYGILIEVDLDLTVSSDQSFGLSQAVPLADDAERTSTIHVPDDREIASVRAGIRVNHPRISDLVFHLISPQGTRLLLSENRGGPDGTAYGADLTSGRLFTTFTDDTNLTVTPIKIGKAPFTNNAVVTTASNRVVLADGFEAATARRYVAGEAILPGWRVTSGSAEVIRSPVGSTNVVEGVQYLTFPEGSVSAVATNVVLSRGKLYRLRFSTGRLPIGVPQGLTVYVDGRLFHEVRREGGPAGWYNDSFLFSSTSQSTLIEFRGPTAQSGRAAMALDNVFIEETDRPFNAYYLPEESMKPLIGERALGNWQLEVLDNRAGPLGVGAGDLDWRLEFVYALPSIDAIRLTNNVPFFDTVSGTDIRYFYVDVPRCATVAINTVSGAFGTLFLFGDRDGLPTADTTFFQDDYGPYFNIEPGGRAEFTLTTNFPALAPLVPGQRYYLAVRNFQPDLTNNAFGIRVQFDCEDPPLPVVPSLTNNVPQVGTIDPGPGLHYYQFIVSSNAVGIEFELTPGNGNVDMYVRSARPSTSPDLADDFPLPSPNLWDYKADDPDPLVVDVIDFGRTSAPEPLVPGVWFVAIRNTEVFPVDYTIRVSERYTTITPLTNAVPLTATLPPIDPFIGVTGDDLHYYSFLVLSNSVRAHFETFAANGDVNLYVRHALPIPTPFDFDFAGMNPGALEEFIAVTNTTTPIWLTPGWWYLAVENVDVGDVTYTIQATEFPANIIALTNNIAVTNVIGPGENLDYYSFPVSSNALSAKFEVFGMTGDVQLLLREALPVPTFNDYTYASTNAGLTPEEIELTPFSFPLGLQPGNWYLSIANPSTNNNATYVVRASEETATVIPLTNGVPYNAGLPPGAGLNYYQFQVSSNATAAEFLLTSAGTGDLDLFLRKGPPLPGAGNAHYFGTNSGVVDEVIRIETNSLPVPLSPGIWYLSVTNKEAVPISYEITATEFGVVPPPVAGEIIDINPSPTETCITWVSVPGTNYFVVAKANVLDLVWTPVSPTITAIATNTTYCVAPPGPWRYFDIFEGDSPVSPIPSPIPDLSFDGTNICVSWTSVVGTNYFVQGKAAFTDPNWTTLTPSIVATATTTEVCYPISWGYRWFRVGVGAQVVPTPTALPPDVVELDATLDQICITWPTQSGLDYLVEGKRNLADLNFTVISEAIRGDGLPQTLCLDGSTDFRYFRVIEGVSIPPGPPPSVAVPNFTLSVDSAFQLCLTWDTLVGSEYFVEGKERLADPGWTIISPILEATGIQLSYCQPLGSVWRYLQLRRVNAPPTVPIAINAIVITPTGPLIQWTGPAGARFQLFYADSLMGVWVPLGGPVTSLTSDFEFLDDGSLTGGHQGARFYRIERLP